MSSREKETDVLLPYSKPRDLAPTAVTEAKTRKGYIRVLKYLLIWACVVNVYIFWDPLASLFPRKEQVVSEELCPQISELIPLGNGQFWSELRDLYQTEGFRAKAIDWLAGAVRVPTESFDKMGPIGEDPRWEIFGQFHNYLLESFPLIHTTLELTKVNTYGLVYVWKGSDESLKPLLLAAHQDVVPVHPDTVKQWRYPPFSGYYDGKLIWGRGSSDDKSGLISIMTTIETMIEKGFHPSRTVVLAYGFDEETSGLFGAKSLGPYLEETFGENGFSMLVDEGAGYQEKFGSVFATPGVGEKGYIDVRVEVTAPGGHSSIPPPHTSIGMLSSLLVRLEENPFEAKLARDTPVYGTVQCWATHGKNIPKNVKRMVEHSVFSDGALKEVQGYFFQDVAFKTLAGTTQAADLIGGGVKTNALPEVAWAVVNHRIATDSNITAVEKDRTDLFESLASTYNLSYVAFGAQMSDADAPAYGTLTLSDAWGTGLEPAPIAPSSNSAPYDLLAGTIKATYNAHHPHQVKDIIVAPGIMSGNTDTRYYWKLTEHIFRYNHHNGGKGAALLNGVHTTNEFLPVDTLLEVILFFSTLILNVDEATTL